jgi:hypothetical protein
MAELVQRTSEVTTVHPPLFFVMLRSWILMVGDSEWCLRSLACLLGIAGIPGSYLAARNVVLYLSTPRVDRAQARFAGGIAAAIFALNPFQLHLSQQVRGYTLAVLLCLLSTAALAGLLGDRARRVKWAVLYVVTAALACYSHHLAILTIVSQGLFAIFWAYSPRGVKSVSESSPENTRSCRRLLWAVAAVMVPLLSLLAIPLVRQTEAAADAWMRPFRVKDISSELSEALFLNSSSPKRISELVDPVAIVVLCAILILCLVATGWPGRCVALLSVLPVWTLTAYSLVASRSLFDARYFAFAQCIWLVGCGVICGQLISSRNRSLALLLSCYVCVQLPLLQRPDEQATQHGIRTALERLEKRTGPGDLILAVTPAVFFESSYYGRHGPSIRLYSDIQERAKHEAAAHLDDGDLITKDEIDAIDPARIWILTMPAYNKAAERYLPSLDRYGLASQGTWTQDWSWEKTVALLEYTRKGNLASQPARGIGN